MTKILSVNSYGTKRVAIIRSEMESFEIIIDKKTGLTEFWKANFKKLNRGYEQEVYPTLVTKQKTKELSKKYISPKEMIENYMMLKVI